MDTSLDRIIPFFAAYLVIVGGLAIDGARSMTEPHYRSKMGWVVAVSLTWPLLPLWALVLWWVKRATMPAAADEANTEGDSP